MNYCLFIFSCFINIFLLLPLPAKSKPPPRITNAAKDLSNEYLTESVNVGAKLLLVLSRGGATDITLTQSWVASSRAAEIGLTTLSVGYAVTRNLRLSTDIQKQNSRNSIDSRVGIVLEWIP